MISQFKEMLTIWMKNIVQAIASFYALVVYKPALFTVKKAG